MHFFLQLNLETLPAWAPGCPQEGLLQMFHCCSDSQTQCKDGGWEPFSFGSVVRIVDPVLETHTPNLNHLLKPFPPCRIIDWQPVDQYPEIDEFKEGLTIEEMVVLGDYNYLEIENYLGWPP